MTAARPLGGLSAASEKPKLQSGHTQTASSAVVTALLTAVGASLTERTLTVRVAVSALVSPPLWALPPLSWILKPTVAYGLPLVFFFNDTATSEISTLSLHAALPSSPATRATPL